MVVGDSILKRAAILIDFGSSDEGKLLMDNLDEYIRLLGWSRKRMYLMGCAAVIGKNGDAPRLIEQIADYLAGRGSLKGRPPKYFDSFIDNLK